MAEWSTHPYDQIVYRDNIKRAGYNPADVLPAPENWVSPMRWFRETGPSLPGFQLAYVACLYHSSDLVFRWHDAIVDAIMLMDILSTRQQKYHHRKVEVPASSPSILLLFDQGPKKRHQRWRLSHSTSLVCSRGQTLLVVPAGQTEGV